MWWWSAIPKTLAASHGFTFNQWPREENHARDARDAPLPLTHPLKCEAPHPNTNRQYDAVSFFFRLWHTTMQSANSPLTSSAGMKASARVARSITPSFPKCERVHAGLSWPPTLTASPLTPTTSTSGLHILTHHPCPTCEQGGCLPLALPYLAPNGRRRGFPLIPVCSYPDFLPRLNSKQGLSFLFRCSCHPTRSAPLRCVVPPPFLAMNPPTPCVAPFPHISPSCCVAPRTFFALRCPIPCIPPLLTLWFPHHVI